MTALGYFDFSDTRCDLEAVLGTPRTGGGVRSGPGRGSNGDGAHRGSQRRCDQEGKTSSNWATMPTCPAFHAPVTVGLEIITATHGKKMRKDLVALLREYCQQQHLVHHCGRDRTLRRVVTMGTRLFGEVKRTRTSLSTTSTTACRSRFAPG